MKNIRLVIVSAFFFTTTFAYSQGIEDAKTKCAELGFAKGTEKFGGCVLRLTKVQETPSASRVNFVIQAPRPVVENGGVVPVNITFDPPLMVGTSAKLLVNKEVAYEIQVSEGTLSKFSTRVLFPTNPSTVSIECIGCAGENYQSEVILVAPLQTFNSQPVRVRVAKGPNNIRFLVDADSTISGNFSVSGSGFKVKVLLSKYVVKNPFFGFDGSIGNGQYCGEFVTAGSAKLCSEN
jgi:hypothetical protein